VLSTVPGTSNSVASLIGFPAWRDSTPANSAARSSRRAAALVSTWERSPGVAPDQAGKASRAAWTAACTSSGPAIVTVSTVVPFEGSMTLAWPAEPLLMPPAMYCTAASRSLACP
jgi:hypothetical protein